MPAQLRKPRGAVEEIIEAVVAQGQTLLQEAEQRTEQDYTAWVHATERWHAYGREALHSAYATDKEGDEFFHAATGRIYRRLGQSIPEEYRNRCQATRAALNTLQSLLERLELAEEPIGAATSGRESARDQNVGRKIFLVHGHDDALRTEVARTLEKLELEPVLLSEKADEGRTLIEKFEAHALNVQYAVVLLSADDLGHDVEESPPDGPNRARQNVILELGYFMGTLGRSRVTAIHQPGVELPSDIHGLAYTRSDEAWPMKLVRELRAAGYKVDANRLV